MSVLQARLPGAPSLNGLPVKPYEYRGTGTDTLTPELDAEPVWPCGTSYGYSRHKNAGEPKCDDCRDAYNKERREQYAAEKAALRGAS